MQSTWRSARSADVVVAAICWLILALAPALAEDVRATAFSMSGDTDSQRIELTLAGEADLNWFLLRGPHRLVLDFAATTFVFEPESLKANRMIESVRYGDVREGRSRLILAARKPFTVEKMDIGVADDKGVRKLVIEIRQATAAAFDAAMLDQHLTTASTAPGATISAPPEKRFTIVLDPGHGGIDGGARGGGGVSEKEITLAFARELKAKLDGRYDVILTRTDDRFVRLDERVRSARSKSADLFVSIHADTIRYKDIRGATVYTVSDEASDAEAEALAARENLADQVAGIEIEEDNQDVADILIELVRRETHGFSVGFARQLVGKLSDVTGMIKNPHRHAGFRVLRAPDVPSVLLELGYLSNEKDEAQLLDPEWRGKMAQSVVGAIDAFAAKRISLAN